MVGSALMRQLKNKDVKIITKDRSELNLLNQQDVQDFFKNYKIDQIYLAAAKVGGIHANNTYRAEFLLDNLKINLNLFDVIKNFKNIKVVNLGSSCIYPLNAKNPINENSFLEGKLEPTNSPYAIAKITGIELGREISKQYGIDIINLMPTNLYGPNDNFSDMNSHVIPGLIYRMHNAKVKKNDEFLIWGSGKPLREFMYVDDLSECINFLIGKELNEDLINVGTGEEISIINLANMIKETMEYEGSIKTNLEMPDGNPRKLLDSGLINSLGWSSSTSLKDGLKKTYSWFLENI